MREGSSYSDCHAIVIVVVVIIVIAVIRLTVIVIDTRKTTTTTTTTTTTFLRYTDMSLKFFFSLVSSDSATALFSLAARAMKTASLRLSVQHFLSLFFID